jgi:hypothetical protein
MLCLLLQANIAVYQAGQPRWSITNFPPGERTAAPDTHCCMAGLLCQCFASFTTAYNELEAVLS